MQKTTKLPAKFKWIFGTRNGQSWVEVSLFLLHYYIKVLLLDTSSKCNLATCIFNRSNCYWALASGFFNHLYFCPGYS